MLWIHRRGGRAVGSFVDLPYIGKRVNVNGRGEFEVPGDSPEELFVFLKEQARHRPYEPPKQVKVLESQPKPEPQKEPVKSDWYPEELLKIPGVGKKSLSKFVKEFPSPESVLDYDGNPTHVKGLNVRVWSKIKDYTKYKLEE